MVGNFDYLVLSNFQDFISYRDKVGNGIDETRNWLLINLVDYSLHSWKFCGYSERLIWD